VADARGIEGLDGVENMEDLAAVVAQAVRDQNHDDEESVHDDDRSGDGEPDDDPDNGDGASGAIDETQRQLQLAFARNRRLGAAMLASLVFGFGPLRDAALGVGPLEEAIARYLLVLGVCAGAAVVLSIVIEYAIPGPSADDQGGPAEDAEA